MPHKKVAPPPPAPPVVSTGCSSFMSCLSLHRRRAPAPDEAPLQERPSHAAAEQYWKRVQFLEEEIRRLGRRLGQEETPPATGRAIKARDQQGQGGGHGADGAVQEMAKLEDGSYLHELRRAGRRPWERLAIQVSQTVHPENAASASEVLDKMTKTSTNELCRILVKAMPMKDIAGRRNPGETVRRTARLNSGDDLLDAVLFNAMDKMEGLVLEGLKIQMAPTATDITDTAAGEKWPEGTTISKDCMVHVVLIQARDPKEGYCAIGNPMIGLMEASMQRREDKVKLEMQGLHIAGISATSRDKSDGRGLMWSASLRECRGGAGAGDGCRCSYVRNPDRVFQR